MKAFTGFLFLLFDSFCVGDVPIALHDLVVVEPMGDAVIRLKGYDLDGDKLKYHITMPPDSGKLTQLSQVFSKYGYDPKAGTIISNSGNIQVTGSKNRVYYKRPFPDAAKNMLWTTFTFKVSDPKFSSYNGTITIVPPSGAIVGSDFLLDNEGWTIVGNKALSAMSTYEPYSRGIVNHYIIGSDNKINVQRDGEEDKSLWYFSAPSSFLGNKGISYGGQLSFTLAAFSGDFNSLNDNAHLIELDCDECIGPVGKGITLAYPLSKALKETKTSFSQGAMEVKFSVELLESSGWLKDSQNTLKDWSPPSQCDIIQVLSRLSSVRILGDLTRWYESVALDDVQIGNKVSKIPVCAMIRPDASVCNCP